MAKSIQLKNNTYWDSTSIVHNKKKLSEILNTKDIYSTNEIKTNKVWIDGKPIYRKVTLFTLNTSTEFKGYDMKISNINEIINQDIQFFYSTANGFYKIPYYESSNYFVVGLVRKDGVLMLTQTGFGGSTIKSIIEYTKTTD